MTKLVVNLFEKNTRKLFITNDYLFNINYVKREMGINNFILVQIGYLEYILKDKLGISSKIYIK